MKGVVKPRAHKMSAAFKKRAKSVQRQHRERGQPAARKHLGLLEKHKDYIQRSTAYKKKAAELKRLHEKARNRNKDEFYYKMINTKLREGRHVISQPEESYTLDQLKVMKTQDFKYVQLKLSTEKSKIEKLRSTLHETESGGRENTHIIFVDDPKEADREEKEVEKEEVRQEEEEKEDDFLFEDLSEVKSKQKHTSKLEDIESVKDGDSFQLYNELEKRIERSQKLKELDEEMRLQKHLLNKKEKHVKIKMEGQNRVTYKWLPERKR